MIQHKLTVSKDIIEPIPLIIPSGNVETHELVFDFSADWDGLKKIAVFTRDGTIKEYTIDDTTRTVPGDMLAEPGTVTVGVYGYIVDGEKLVKRLSTNVINVIVIKGAYASADPGEDVPPSAYEQLSSKVDDHIADKANPHNVTASQVGAYSKAETDTALAGKLDKVKSLVRVYPGVYATESTDGTPQLITATSDLSYIGTGGGYIPLYADGGQLKTAEPTADDSAANKAYVDGKTAPLASKEYVDSKPIQVKDGDIEWGGANRANDYSPVDAAMISKLGANRFAFIDPTYVTVEYSNDGGGTWTDYGAANSTKTAFFSDLINGDVFTVGKRSTSNPSTANDKLRIAVSVYNKLACGFRKFAIYSSSYGAVNGTVTIQGQKNSSTTTDVLAENVPLKGWPGYNIVNLASNAILGISAGQYGKLIFTFFSDGSSGNKGLTINGIFGFGGAGAGSAWSFPSNMATNGHIYSWNAQQDTTFPARVKSLSVPVSYNDLTNKKYVDSKTAVLTNPYALIETITLTEATEMIERSSAPDGTAYSFAKLLITVDTPKTDTVEQQNIRLYINDGTLDYYAYYQSLTTYAKRAHFDCVVDNGVLKIRIGNGATNYGGENTGVTAMIENANIVFLSAINKIKLKGEATFAVGTVIKIYGVRA